MNMDWVKNMDGYNFIGIYDVMLDIKTEMNISPDKIIIPLLPNMIKFAQLFPVDSIGTRDDYCGLRWKATEFLKKNGIIKDFGLIEDFDRWESELEISLEREEFEETLNAMKKEYKERSQGDNEKPNITDTFWDLLHPKISEVSKSRFDSDHFADSVEAALKEVNTTIKNIVKQTIAQEYDGADLMNKAFSLNNPIIVLDDLSTESGRNIQKGYMQIYAGTMTGIRNPKAHENLVIDSQRAIHFLFLASLLMFKIDEQRGI